MNAAKVISFRRDYYTTRLPVKAQWYQCGELGGTCRLTAQIIHSAHELSAFQDEVSEARKTPASGFSWYTLSLGQPRRCDHPGDVAHNCDLFGIVGLVM
jgi:hypothetical protein